MSPKQKVVWCKPAHLELRYAAIRHVMVVCAVCASLYNGFKAKVPHWEVNFQKSMEDLRGGCFTAKREVGGERRLLVQLACGMLSLYSLPLCKISGNVWSSLIIIGQNSNI